MWDYVVVSIYGFITGAVVLMVCLLFGFDVTVATVQFTESLFRHRDRILKGVVRGRANTRSEHRIGREMLEGLTAHTRTIQPMQLSAECWLHLYLPQLNGGGAATESTGLHDRESMSPCSAPGPGFPSSPQGGTAGPPKISSPVSPGTPSRPLNHSRDSLQENKFGSGAANGAHGVKARKRRGSTSSTTTFGEPIHCKLVLQDDAIRIYELLPAKWSNSTGPAAPGGPDHTNAEHYRGQIKLDVIRAKRLKGHVPGVHIRASAVPKNRRIFIEAEDGGMLFDSSRKKAEGGGHGNAMLNSNSFLGTDPGSVGIEHGFQGLTSPISLMLSGAYEGFPTAQQCDAMADGTATGGGCFPFASHLLCWKGVMLEFPNSLQAERWWTVLEGLDEAEAWREFVKEMPNPDTFNLFLCRLLYPSIRREGLENIIKTAIRKKLVEVAKKKFPRFITGQIELDDFILGASFPWISDVSTPSISTNGEIGFDLNLLYKGEDRGFALYFKMALFYRGMRIPHIIIALKLLELQATLHISIGPPPSLKVWIGIHRPPILRVRASQGCSSGRGLLHRVLASLPDMSLILTHALRLYLFSEMILPEMDDFPLPSVEKTPPVSPSKSGKKKKKQVFDRTLAAKRSRRHHSDVLEDVEDADDDAESRELEPDSQTGTPARPARRYSFSRVMQAPPRPPQRLFDEDESVGAGRRASRTSRSLLSGEEEEVGVGAATVGEETLGSTSLGITSGGPTRAGEEDGTLGSGTVLLDPHHKGFDSTSVQAQGQRAKTIRSFFRRRRERFLGQRHDSHRYRGEEDEQLFHGLKMMREMEGRRSSQPPSHSPATASEGGDSCSQSVTSSSQALGWEDVLGGDRHVSVGSHGGGGGRQRPPPLSDLDGGLGRSRHLSEGVKNDSMSLGIAGQNSAAAGDPTGSRSFAFSPVIRSNVDSPTTGNGTGAGELRRRGSGGATVDGEGGRGLLRRHHGGTRLFVNRSRTHQRPLEILRQEAAEMNRGPVVRTDEAKHHGIIHHVSADMGTAESTGCFCQRASATPKSSVTPVAPRGERGSAITLAADRSDEGVLGDIITSPYLHTAETGKGNTGKGVIHRFTGFPYSVLLFFLLLLFICFAHFFFRPIVVCYSASNPTSFHISLERTLHTTAEIDWHVLISAIYMYRSDLCVLDPHKPPQQSFILNVTSTPQRREELFPHNLPLFF
eukprot:gene12295-8436_t